MFSRDDPTARIGDARRHRPLVRVNSNNVARAVGRDQHARRTRPPSPAGHICSTLHWYGYGGPGRQRPGGDRRFARSTLLSGQTGSRKHGPRSTLLTQDTTKGSRHYSGQTPVRLSTLTRTVARVRANPISTPGRYGRRLLDLRASTLPRIVSRGLDTASMDEERRHARTYLFRRARRARQEDRRGGGCSSGPGRCSRPRSPARPSKRSSG